MIRTWLRKLIGLDQDMDNLRTMVETIHQDMVIMRSDFTVTLYEPDDPRRKKASDVLGRTAINRLIAEDKARKHTLGEL